MSTLIPEIIWTDFVKLVKQGKLKDLKSCEVTFNGLYLFTAIIPHGDMYTNEFARTRSEYLAVKSNIVGGKDLEQLKEEEKSLARV